MKPIKQLLGVSLILGGFVAVFTLLHAQETATPTQSGTDLTAASTDASAMSDLQVEVQAIEMTTPEPASAAPLDGNFYSTQHLPGTENEWPPLPENIKGTPVWPLGGDFYLLDDANVSYNPPTTNTLTASGGMQAMTDFTPLDLVSSSLVSGTNLWLAITNLANSTAGLMLSNTIADVQYEIQGTTNLTGMGASNWITVGTVLGSEITNWTATSIAATNQPTLFLRVRSDVDSDNVGIPDWWQLQYFGYVGVDPNSDPTGDGWTLLQDFQNSMNPNVFYTPPAPQGLTVSSYNAGTSTATLTWLPSPGPVTGYTIETPSGNFPVSSGTEFVDSASSLTASYQVQAHYPGGDSAWSASVSVPSNFSIFVIAGSLGSAYMVIPSLPTGAQTIRITRDDSYAEDFFNYSFDTYFDIPVSNITNGLCLIPASCVAAPVDSYNFADYVWSAQILDTNNNAISQSSYIGVGYNNGADVVEPDWLVPPYLDGRAALKQDLIFQLRAANATNQFQLQDAQLVSFSANYVYEGFYDINNYNQIYGAYPANSPLFDAFLPFEDNYMFRNYVFNNNDVDSSGNLTTGILYSDVTYESENPVLEIPPTYQFQIPLTNGTPITSMLNTNDSLFICMYPLTLIYSGGGDGIIGFSVQPGPGSAIEWTLNSNVRNYWGLPFVSAEVYYTATNYYLVNSVINAGNSFLTAGDNLPVYMETAQPQFQTVEYDFWNVVPWNDYYTITTNLIPGMTNFSTGRTSDLLITSVGNPNFQVVGYAKLAVTNSYYTGVYGYLGQYFTNAYQIDTNGIVTTNTTGVLSPYGQFFATQPGPVALVTMPDPDTGAQGTGVVHCISLNVDKNHDGTIDLSFNGPDVTSQSSPMEFWANNNYDRWKYDSDDNTNYQDDVQIQGCPATPNTPTPDCNYSNVLSDGYAYRAIPDTRDLVDFTRLWVCGITTNLLAALPAGSTVTLNWGDVGSPNSGNPTIDLFTAADADGGIGYQTNETIAAEQTNALSCPYVGRLGPGGSIQLNASTFADSWAGNHFIWCGVSNGTGGLNLTITDANSNMLGQATVYIQIQDIKQMYERWTVGDNPNVAPTNTAYLVADGLTAGEMPFQYTPATAGTPYIMFVHGWNMEYWEKDRFAESAFKRLYWQGYQGRFGEFRWPTGFGFTGWQTIATNLTEKDNFDSSEYAAWQSGQGLLNKLNDLNTQYPGSVYLLAHSMGNVVAGEALRLAGSSQVVNTYVASQAAVSAHAYDTNIANYSFYYPPWSLSADTPNIYGNWFAGNSGGGAGQVISFYNVNDFALQRSVWQRDELLKPDQDVLEGTTTWYYGYSGSVSDPAPWNNFYNKTFSGSTIFDFNIVTSLSNRHEVMGYAAQSYTTALGATAGVHHLADSIDLTGVWLPDPTGNDYTEHFYHSAEFRGDNPQQRNYWSELMGSDGFNLK